MMKCISSFYFYKKVYLNFEHNNKNADNWIPLCFIVVVEHVIVMNVLYLNSMINHCLRKTIVSEDVVSS